jgi:septal ring factor EnvC (AmiA/AmiB activator)
MNMNMLKRIAIVAIAGFGGFGGVAGFGILAQAQEYTNKFNNAKREMDGLMQSMKYGDVVDKIRAIIPAEIPDFPRDPANPQAVVKGFYEMGSLQDFHDYLYRALLMSGDTEGAIACIKTAEEIAKRNAADTETGLAPTIESWSKAVGESTKSIEEAAPIKEKLEAEKESLQAEKAQIESMPKRKRAHNQRLAAIEADLAAIEADLAALAQDMAVWENNVKRAPATIDQLNGYIDTAKKDAAKFANDIKDMESDLAAEGDEIESKHGGSKAKYVAAVLRDASAKDQKEKVRFLNRLLFLDPKNAAVKKQLDAAIDAALGKA